jgi:hypothetical protein
MTKINRRPTRVAVLRSLAELATLWRPPEKETAARGETEAAAEETKEQSKFTPARGEPQRGRR